MLQDEPVEHKLAQLENCKMENPKAMRIVKDIDIRTISNGPIVVDLICTHPLERLRCEVYEADVLKAVFSGVQALSFSKAHPSLALHVLADIDTSTTPHLLKWMSIDTHPPGEAPNNTNGSYFTVTTANVEHGEDGNLIAILTDLTGRKIYCHVYDESLKQALYTAIGMLSFRKIGPLLGPHVVARVDETQQPNILTELVLQSQG
ncbi:hypothetical protein [Pseudomonas sichuanensis]|uniref:hypothetical protein n=1 Tax=Pseudomonas TaxID=286 RepID=UPI0036EFCA96